MRFSTAGVTLSPSARMVSSENFQAWYSSRQRGE